MRLFLTLTRPEVVPLPDTHDVAQTHLERKLASLDREVTRLIDAYRAEVIDLTALRERRRECKPAPHILPLVLAVGMLYNTSHMPWTHTHEERDDDLRLCWCGGLGGQGPRKM